MGIPLLPAIFAIWRGMGIPLLPAVFTIWRGTGAPLLSAVFTIWRGMGIPLLPVVFAIWRGMGQPFGLRSNPPWPGAGEVVYNFPFPSNFEGGAVGSSDSGPHEPTSRKSLKGGQVSGIIRGDEMIDEEMSLGWADVPSQAISGSLRRRA